MRVWKKVSWLYQVKNNLEMMIHIRKRKIKTYQKVRVKQLYLWQTSKIIMRSSLMKMLWSRPTLSVRPAALRRKGNSKHPTTSWTSICVNMKLTKKFINPRRVKMPVLNVVTVMKKNFQSLSRVERMHSRSSSALFAWSWSTNVSLLSVDIHTARDVLMTISSIKW